MKYLLHFLSLLVFSCAAQKFGSVNGTVYDADGKHLPFCSVGIAGSTLSTNANLEGKFTLSPLPVGLYSLIVQASGMHTATLYVSVPGNAVKIKMLDLSANLNEVVVTGTLKEISKDESPINIDIVTPRLFQKTATANLFEATGLVNGVKPQINCNVCNTGDIHINGMEGPYTLILIDGMPIVSGLSSVYGLMGIPASMIERLEIAKGPAGALYGSEAMGGTINLITKNPLLAPKIYTDYFVTSYLENNLDLGLKIKTNPKINWLLGANAYWYTHKKDINDDGFTDVTLQKRFSLFNKMSVNRKSARELSLAARVVAEDRWGGEMNWTPQYRGGDSIYGESIYAKRAELIGRYQWPGKQNIFSQVSYNLHDQNSVYGRIPFIAKQSTAFAQTYWNRKLGRFNDFTGGLSFKNLWYDDNTGATGTATKNEPDKSNTLGIFFQNETTFDTLSKHKLLSGLRLDYNNIYHVIPSPRLAYKWTPHYRFTARLNFATGFRIVNVFTEDHAALTGAREVVFEEKIRPEKSYNGSINLVWKMKLAPGTMLLWDFTGFYYHFTNKIYANYDLDPNKVIYRNLNGFAYSRGIALNLSVASTSPFKINAGFTYSDVKNVSRDSLGKNHASLQLQTPLWSGNINAGYMFAASDLKVDVTGNWYGPQRLPVLPADFRPEYSPWFFLLNFQISKMIQKKVDCYAGVKNILNFLPKNPIMRPQDPFDKKINDTKENPYGYTFDPSYSYAPMQGIRFYLGFRLSIN